MEPARRPADDGGGRRGRFDSAAAPADAVPDRPRRGRRRGGNPADLLPVRAGRRGGHPRAAAPILASDQALFTRVAREAPRRVAVLGPLDSAVQDTVRRLREFLNQPGLDPGDVSAEVVSADVHVEGLVVAGVGPAAANRDLDLLERLVADQARRVAPSVDLIVLGQFSLTPALRAAQAAVSVPVLSPPHLAAGVLREQLDTARVSA